ncbi:unnamed protein product [Chrysoparadoxa australica]
MVALAKLALKSGDVDAAMQHSKTALRANDSNEQAAMVLAEVMLLKGDHQAATSHYQRLLTQRPNHYPALANLIGLMRRAGTLKEAEQYLEMSEHANQRAVSHAGFHFCKGLFYRQVEAFEGIRHFNMARRDGEWGARALQHMVEMYLNPDGVPIWEGDGGKPENLSVAEQLLSELKVCDRSCLCLQEANGEDCERPMELRVKVLEGLVKLASHEKRMIDASMQEFIELLEIEKDFLPALLGMSFAFMLEKEPNKARNALKRIAKIPYSPDMADEFEQSYLLLAFLYMDRGKFDLSQDLGRRCLSYNKSCSKAWETMGLIMEKEQSYSDAAECYERSWELEHQASAVIGFKLAFNYLKANRFVDAIDVCTKVLGQYPDYPRIREEILSKAEAGLRP